MVWFKQFKQEKILYKQIVASFTNKSNWGQQKVPVIAQCGVRYDKYFHIFYNLLHKPLVRYWYFHRWKTSKGAILRSQYGKYWTVFCQSDCKYFYVLAIKTITCTTKAFCKAWKNGKADNYFRDKLNWVINSPPKLSYEFSYIIFF